MPYEFTQDGFKSFTDAVLAANGDQATLTTILADMQDTFTDGIGRVTKAEADRDTANAERERLKNANMELFLRIGSMQETKPSDELKPKPPMSTTDYMQSFFDKQNGGK